MTSIADYANDDDVDISAIVAAVDTETYGTRTVGEYVCKQCGGPRTMEDTMLCGVCCGKTCGNMNTVNVGDSCAVCREVKAGPSDGPGPQPTEDHQLHTVCCNCGWDYTYEDSLPRGSRRWESVWDTGYFYGTWRDEDGMINTEYYEAEDTQWDDAIVTEEYLQCPECDFEVEVKDGKTVKPFAEAVWVGPEDANYLD